MDVMVPNIELPYIDLWKRGWSEDAFLKALFEAIRPRHAVDAIWLNLADCDATKGIARICPSSV